MKFERWQTPIVFYQPRQFAVIEAARRLGDAQTEFMWSGYGTPFTLNLCSEAIVVVVGP